MELDGRALRRLLVTWLMDTPRVMTVDDLVERLDATGFSVRGRAGKVVSDSLRWEVARGRVVRLRRGRYVVGEIPRSTAWRIRSEARALLSSASIAPHEVRAAEQQEQLLAGLGLLRGS